MKLSERTQPSHEQARRIDFQGTIEWNSANDSMAAEELKSVPEPEAGAADPTERNDKKAVTFGIRTSLKKRAEMAVLRTGGYPGGHTSFAALVESAIERELERLAIEFNNGEPFPRNAGGFRQGRPLGS